MALIALTAWLACSEGPLPLPPSSEQPIARLTGPSIAYLGEPILLDASASEHGDQFWWTTSPGEPAEQQGPTYALSLSPRGAHLVGVEVISADGRSDTATLAVTVVSRPLDQAPRQAGPLTKHPADGSLFAVLPDHDLLVHVRGGALLSATPTCAGPRYVDASTDWVAVSCPASDTLSRYTYASGQLQPGEPLALPQGASPQGLVLHDQAGLVALSGDGALWRFGPTGPANAEAALGPDLRGLAWRPGLALVTRFRSQGQAELWSVPLDEALHAQDAPTSTALPQDPGPDSDTDARGLPNLLGALAIRPDGEAVVVGGLKANLARGLYREGRALSPDSTARAYLRELPLVSSAGSLVAAPPQSGPRFDDRDLVSAAAWDPQGTRLYVAFSGAEAVDLYEPATYVRQTSLLDVGHQPDGLALSDDGLTLYVLATLSRELVAYDLSAPGLAQVEAWRLPLASPDDEPLSPEALLGAITFHRSVDPRMSQASYLSCASCHPDGTTDGQTWDFTDRGEGLRNTSTLRDLGDGPFHWSANFDELQDFEQDIRGPQGGRGFLSDADFAATQDALGAPKAGISPELDGLAAYMLSLSPAPLGPAQDNAQVALGEALFFDDALGCADCHQPPRYTDAQWRSPAEPLLHDVGTLTEASGTRRGQPLLGLRTPPLLGLHATAPYLHDGRAVALADIFTASNPSDQHGRTSQLSADELDALCAFLASL